MSEIDTLIFVTAAAMIVIYLIGPAIWRITKTLGEWLLLILVLIWVL